jgi:hypothetical protein
MRADRYGRALRATDSQMADDGPAIGDKDETKPQSQQPVEAAEAALRVVI